MGFLFENIDKFTGLSPVIPPDILSNHSAANAGHVESMLAKFMSGIVFEHCYMIIVLLVRMINCIHLLKYCQVTAFPYLLLHYLWIQWWSVWCWSFRCWMLGTRACCDIDFCRDMASWNEMWQSLQPIKNSLLLGIGLIFIFDHRFGQIDRWPIILIGSRAAIVRTK